MWIYKHHTQKTRAIITAVGAVYLLIVVTSTGSERNQLADIDNLDISPEKEAIEANENGEKEIFEVTFNYTITIDEHKKLVTFATHKIT